MNVVLRETWTVERFLAWEDQQEGKHEFDGVQIIEMTGGSRAHQRIVFNIMRWLVDALNPDLFDVIQEMRITNGRQVRYPDIMICAGRIGGRVRTVHDAVVLIEVLSDDTAETDRNRKRDDYAHLPGLRRYLLIEQTTAAAKVLQRTVAGWTESDVTSGHIALPEVGADIPLAAIYVGVDLV